MRSAHHLSGTPAFARAPGQHDIFRIEARLHAEAAADVADQHAHLVRRNAQHACAELVAQSGRRLATDAQRDPLGRRVVAREDRARLDRARRDALVDEVERDDVRRPGERRGCRPPASPCRASHAMLPVAAGQTSGAPARHRGVGVGHRRQRIVADVDRLDRVARLLRALRDHRGHRFADEAHGSDGQRVSRRRRRRRAVGALEVGRQRQRLDACRAPGPRRSRSRSRPACRQRPACRSSAMRACGCGERRKQTYAWPGTEKSSAKRPAPVSSASSSTRRTDLPLPKRAYFDSAGHGENLERRRKAESVQAAMVTRRAARRPIEREA